MERYKGIGLLLLHGRDRPVPVHVTLSMQPPQEGRHLKWYGDCQIGDPRDAITVSAQTGYRADLLLGDSRKARVLITQASHDGICLTGEEPLPAEIPSTRREGCDVVIVEDDLAVAKALERQLRLAGYSTRVCVDAANALLTLTQIRPRLILLDLLLPDLRGWDVLQAIRSNPLVRDIPVIVLTAVEETRAELYFAGQQANAYLRKPADMHRVLEQVGALIAGADEDSQA